ncbi:MAG: RnfABCDGE type electron transport complex subunit A [Clostridia bacterium]|nr:RnfABCDGE type electron transport complex subunit A [Clostridia bacterium]
MNIFTIIIGAVFVNNFILVKFLGICPFLGVSKKTDSALGMGVAVIFVMTLASLITYVLDKWLLSAYGLEFLQTIVFIFVIAALVQIVEMIIKKISPTLYNALGVYLPLITTNCAILGVALLLVTGEVYGVMINNLFEAVLYGLFAGVGFTLALFLMSGLRQKVDSLPLPKVLKGFPITLITASLMAMAFAVFA